MKTIFISGITGQQGNALYRAINKNDFKIVGLSRNLDSEKSKKLIAEGVGMIQGDLMDLNFKDQVPDIHVLYSVQTFGIKASDEIIQGKNIAKFAKDKKVNHFLYSSAAGIIPDSGVPHFDAKIEIENYIKELDLPYTIVRPGSFYQNFLIPQVQGRIKKGSLSSPIKKDILIQFSDVVDIGKSIVHAIKNPKKYLNKTVTVASDEMTMGEVAQTFSKVLEKPIKYAGMPMFLVRLILGKSLHRMYKWVNKDQGVPRSIEEIRKEFPFINPLENWVKENKDLFL